MAETKDTTPAKQRRATEAGLKTNNPSLNAGDLFLASDNGRRKTNFDKTVGKNYNDLPYEDNLLHYLNTASLRAETTPFKKDQIARILGVGKGDFYWDEEDTTSVDDGGMTIVTTDGKRLKRFFDSSSAVSPEYFGAVGDNATDDYAALQAMFDYASRRGVNVIFSHGKEYYTSEGLDYTRYLPYGKSFSISGVSSTLRLGTGASKKLLYRNVLVQTSTESANTVPITRADLLVSQRVSIRGLKLLGAGSIGSVGLDVSATYGSRVDDVNIQGFNTGLDLRFALNTQLNLPIVIECTIGINVRVGDWEGATLSNSQSNNTIINGARIGNKQDHTSTHGIKISGCSGVRLNSPIVEGGNPDYGIHFDFQSSTVVKEFKIFDVHVECTPRNAGISINNATAGQVEIDTIFAQYAHTIVQAVGLGGSFELTVKNLPWFVSGSKFEGVEPKWRFVGNHTSVKSTDAANWVGGVLPASLTELSTSYITGTGALHLTNTGGHNLYAGNGGHFNLGQSNSLFKSFYNLTLETTTLNGGEGNIYLKGQMVRLQTNLASNKITTATTGQADVDITHHLPIYNDSRTLIGYVPITNTQRGGKVNFSKPDFQTLTDAATTIFNVSLGAESSWAITSSSTLQIDNATTAFAAKITGCAGQVVTLSGITNAIYYFDQGSTPLTTTANSITLPASGMVRLGFTKNGNDVFVEVKVY